MTGNHFIRYKDKNVAKVLFNAQGFISKVVEVYDEKLLPPAVNLDDNLAFSIMDWLVDRIISYERPDILGARAFLQKDFLSQAGAISLYDNYWFTPDENAKWEDINAFHNWNPEKDLICLLNLKPAYVKRDAAILSPNLSIPGKDTSFFYKKGDKIFFLCRDIEKDMQLYKRNKDSGIVQTRRYATVAEKLFSIQEIQTSEDIDSVSLGAVYKAFEDPEKSRMDNLLNILSKFGISKNELLKFFDKVYKADESVYTDDRALSTIRILRDANTLETIGFAKI